MARTRQFPRMSTGGIVRRPESHQTPAAPSPDDTESEDGGGDGSAYSSPTDMSDSDSHTEKYAVHAGADTLDPVPPIPRGA